MAVVLLASVISGQAHAERRVAMVVGNSSYGNAVALRNPRNDASDMADALRKLGFEVVLGLDLDQAHFAQTIDAFARAMEGADVALFFYAGHALQMDEKNYLVSVDARLTNEFLISSETMDFGAIVRLMESKVRLNIILLDACRNNPLADNLKQSLSVMRRTDALGHGLARIEPSGRDTLIAYAAAPGREAADGMGRNSPFTAALLKSMSTPGLEISVMLKDVAAEVRQTTGDAQRPQQISDMSQPFYFAPANDKGSSAAPPAQASPEPPVKPVPPASRGGQSADSRELEIAFWNSARRVNECEAMRAYLQRYPAGVFADLARLSEARLCVSERNVTIVETVPKPGEPIAPGTTPTAPPPIAVAPPESAKPSVVTPSPPVAKSLPATPDGAAAASRPSVVAPQSSPPERPSPPKTLAPGPGNAAGKSEQAASPAKSAPPSQVATVKPPPPPPAAGPGSTNAFRDCEQCPEMIGLPGGKFSMGSNDDVSERPVHEVTVAAFAIGRYPVTIGEWRACVADGACHYQPNGEERVPVYNVSWTDAQEYVTWLSKKSGTKYRLPSEAEWEYAARGGSTAKYWWGNDLLLGKAACKGCGTDPGANSPLKVGGFAPNPFGLHDMTGSVDQWVADCWFKDYSGAPRDGSARAAPNCRQYALRGGSWKNDASYLRSSSRDGYDAGVRYLTHGFRVARERK